METYLHDQYRRYLERAERVFGRGEFGSYAKWRGRLIRKLRLEEFESAWKELVVAGHAYEEILTRGDTINDALQKLLAERATDLLLEKWHDGLGHSGPGPKR